MSQHGPYQLTHTAAHQAWYVSVGALFNRLCKLKADYRVFTWTNFIDPKITRVGLNEMEAREKDIAHDIIVYPMDELDRAIAESACLGLVEVLTVPGKDRMFGVTTVGDHAGELFATYAITMKHGVGLNKIMATIRTYPTMSEANKYASEALLNWTERYCRRLRG